jgi:hypothetical protein
VSPVAEVPFPLFLAALSRAAGADPSSALAGVDSHLTAEVLELVQRHPERVAAQVRAWLKETGDE